MKEIKVLGKPFNAIVASAVEKSYGFDKGETVAFGTGIMTEGCHEADVLDKYMKETGIGFIESKNGNIMCHINKTVMDNLSRMTISTLLYFTDLNPKIIMSLAFDAFEIAIEGKGLDSIVVKGSGVERSFVLNKEVAYGQGVSQVLDAKEKMYLHKANSYGLLTHLAVINGKAEVGVNIKNIAEMLELETCVELLNDLKFVELVDHIEDKVFGFFNE